MIKGLESNSASHLISSEETSADKFFMLHSNWSYLWVHSAAFKTTIEPCDIFWQGWENLLKGLFPPDTGQARKFENLDHEKNFIKRALCNAHVDLIRRRKCERRILSQFTLDDPIQDQEGNAMSYSDVIGEPGNFTDHIAFQIDYPQLVKDIKAEIDKIPNALQRLVAQCDLGYADEDLLKPYKKNAIRTARSRYQAYLRKSILVKYRDQMK